MSERLNDIVRNLPVATFYYKGSHSHPVCREILVVDQNRTHITGYELREGHILRDIDDAPVKSYTRSKIATREQVRSDNKLRTMAPTNKSTLVRKSLRAIV